MKGRRSSTSKALDVLDEFELHCDRIDSVLAGG